MKNIKTFENFMGDPLEILVGVARKIEKSLDKSKQINKADLQKIVTDSGEAAMSSKQIDMLADILTDRGYEIK
jgi:hypothetical protein